MRAAGRWAALALALALALAGGACDGLPEIEPPRFACEDDRALEDGAFPCGAGHWCVDAQCVPRLDCQAPGSGRPGCAAFERCEPVLTGELAAVRCEGGIHTETSTRPPELERCACPDGLHCVALVEGGDPETFAGGLRWLPDGGSRLPGEVEGGRWCARACSQEANCPADHTCRPAAALRPGDPVSSRETIGMCFPNLLAETSSTSTVTQPVVGACLEDVDCGLELDCRYEAEPVSDHPTRPVGPFWAGRFALVGRCASTLDFSGKPSGRSCLSSNECFSGLCASGRCRIPCDPRTPEQACGSRLCLQEDVVFSTGLRDVEDTVHLCELL